MKSTYALARTFVTPLFVSGGFDALRNPAAKVQAAKTLVMPLSKMGLSADPETLIKINGGLQLGAGLLLFSGRVPRLASAVLAVSLVPTTVAGHRFWDERDPLLRSAQKIQFMKNLAVLGGVVLLATDTKGAPSLGWRVKKTANEAAESLSAFRSDFGPTGKSFMSEASDRFSEIAHRIYQLKALRRSKY